MQLQEWIWVPRPWVMPLSTITSIISPSLAFKMMAASRQWQIQPSLWLAADVADSSDACAGWIDFHFDLKIRT